MYQYKCFGWRFRLLNTGYCVFRGVKKCISTTDFQGSLSNKKPLRRGGSTMLIARAVLWELPNDFTKVTKNPLFQGGTGKDRWQGL